MHAAALAFQTNAFPHPPAMVLDGFRSARIHNRVSVLTPKAEQFEDVVHAFADGKASLPQVIAGFGQAIKGFADTARAATRVGLLSDDTRSAVDTALESIVDEFRVSFEKVNNALQEMEDANPADAAQFLLEARDRMDQLTDFWRVASSAIEKPGVSLAPRM